MGIGDWGLGIGDWAQSPIPNPQTPCYIDYNISIFMINIKKHYKIHKKFNLKQINIITSYY